MTAGLSLMKNVLTPLAKCVLLPLQLKAAIAAAAARDAAIHKKMFGSGFTTLIISREQMKDIMKMVKSLENSGLLIKGVIETTKNKPKDEQGGR